MILMLVSYGFFVGGIYCFAIGVSRLELFHIVRSDLRTSSSPKRLESQISRLQEIQETIEVGLVPKEDSWRTEEVLGRESFLVKLMENTLSQLRGSGAAVLPSVKRFRAALESAVALQKESKVKSSQARAQAGVCIGLIPLMVWALSTMLPVARTHPELWRVCSFGAMALSVIAFFWILRISNRACWAGLEGEERNWLLLSQLTGEHLLALIRSGTPGDLAWKSAIEHLCEHSSTLGLAWGVKVWGNPAHQPQFKKDLRSVILQSGAELKRAIQVSLMEGRPCAERVEAHLDLLRLDMRMQLERSISLLPTLLLKPLFICVAPSLVGLCVLGFSLSM